MAHSRQDTAPASGRPQPQQRRAVRVHEAVCTKRICRVLAGGGVFVHQAPMLREAGPAKINLTLHVTGRRPDGYHLLDSLVVFAGAHDLLTAEPAATLSLTLSGPFAAGLSAEADNLVLRAARALAKRCGVPAGAALRLDKHLPVASGIGGGSADAAAALRLLCRLWGVSLPRDDLLGMAAALGADVPVCLDCQPARMAGIGEVLLAAPAVPSCGIVLVNPGVALTTQAVFWARPPGFTAAANLPDGWPDAETMAETLAGLGNDLEAPALALCPPIGAVLAELGGLPGCLLARMSGSGATCFALFASPGEAERAANALARPGWWCWGGALWQHAPLYAGASPT